ncbi:unnamed protein product [Boreogadus saida]
MPSLRLPTLAPRVASQMPMLPCNSCLTMCPTKCSSVATQRGAVEVMASAHVPPWPPDAPGNREERGGNVRHKSPPIGQGG